MESRNGADRPAAARREEPELTLADFSRGCGVTVDLVVEMVEEGVLDPAGRDRPEWRFATWHVVHARRALRLRRDLGLNWPGVALALELLDELHVLRRRHRALLRRLEV